MTEAAAVYSTVEVNSYRDIMRKLRIFKAKRDNGGQEELQAQINMQVNEGNPGSMIVAGLLKGDVGLVVKGALDAEDTDYPAVFSVVEYGYLVDYCDEHGLKW